jgi:hypothetical protein
VTAVTVRGLSAIPHGNVNVVTGASPTRDAHSSRLRIRPSETASGPNLPLGIEADATAPAPCDRRNNNGASVVRDALLGDPFVPAASVTNVRLPRPPGHRSSARIRSAPRGRNQRQMTVATPWQVEAAHRPSF